MIELDNTRTWPNEIWDILKENLETINNELKYEFYAYSKGLQWHKSIVTPEYDKAKSKIIEIISRLEIKAYHCTKLTSWEGIYKEGLKTLNYDFHVIKVLEEMKKLEINDDILYRVKESFNRFEREGKYGKRENMLWFVLSRDLTDCRGCEYFFKYFGGEVTRRALEQIESELLPILSNIGIPSVVEFKVKVVELSYKIDYIAERIIKYVINRYIKKVKFSFNCEAYVYRNIDPEDIISIWEKK